MFSNEKVYKFKVAPFSSKLENQENLISISSKLNWRGVKVNSACLNCYFASNLIINSSKSLSNMHIVQQKTKMA